VVGVTLFDGAGKRVGAVEAVGERDPLADRERDGARGKRS